MLRCLEAGNVVLRILRVVLAADAPIGAADPGSLKGEPGLLAESPGVFGSRAWQDWPGGPGGPGGLPARARPAGPRAKKAMAGATNRNLRMTLLRLSSGPGRTAAVTEAGDRRPLLLHETRSSVQLLRSRNAGCTHFAAMTVRFGG
jgi:hypothetical protein